MNLRGVLKYIVVIGFLSSGSVTYAQIFKNYKQELKGEKVSIEMVAVKGGDFSMGTDDSSRKQDEKPVHQVEVNDFWMGKYEITWKQYDTYIYAQHDDTQFTSAAKQKEMGIDAVTGATSPYVDMSAGMGKGSYPAVNTTQYASLMFCKWLTAKTGVFYRLPTEAEWEYVCKKGKTDQVNSLKDYAWYDENSDNKYHETGISKPNSLGIYDLLGNVSEWVLDQYSPVYYASSPKKDPWNFPVELYPRVVRGGSWKDAADKICCTNREGSNPKWKQRDPQIPKSNWWFTDAPFVGFRVVRPKVQPSKEATSKYWLEAVEDFGLD